MFGFANVVLLFVGLAVIIAFMAIQQVPQGQEWTVERFGRYTTTLRPGLSLIMPIMDQVRPQASYDGASIRYRFAGRD